MELFYELLLTAAVTLLAAFLLATLFAANDPPPRRADRAAIAEEVVVEEERIIEVDEVKRSEGRAVAAPAEAEGWKEAEKVPAAVVDEEELESLPEEKGATVMAAREVRLGAGVEEGEKGGCDVKLCDLTPASAPVAEASPQVSGAEAVPGEVLDVAGLEEERAQDVLVKQRDLGAEVAPIEVLEAGQEKQGAEVVQVAEVSPLRTEAVHHHLVAEAAPAQDVLDVGSAEKSMQPIEVRPDELDSATAPGEILGVVLERKEDQTVELKECELPVEAAPLPVLGVPLVQKEDVKDHGPVEAAVEVHEQVESQEEAKCEAHLVDQQEQLVPEKELVAMKTDDMNVSHEGSSSGEVVTELPVESVTLQELSEDGSEPGIDLEEWEGIDRSEVEKRFGVAAAFAASGAGAAALSKLSSDVQLQLQGLLKVAIDGPCYDSTQPLTLRPSSRAKWVAWQKLGNMNPEVAMEKYMDLLSETIPGWMGNEALDTKKHGADSLSAENILTLTAISDRQNNQG